MYSLEDILSLFGISDQLTPLDIRRAKHYVLQTHPDKSGLPSEYFLFYKKAFEQLILFYQQSEREKKKVPTVNPDYIVDLDIEIVDSSAKTQIRKTIGEMSPQAFQQKFNEIFENTMVDNKPDPRKNDWFVKEEPLYETDFGDTNPAAISQRIQNIKSNMIASIVPSSELEHIHNSSSSYGSRLYEEDTENKYVSCDPFSKLKYDDLRKVHKDQTILSVSEKDYYGMNRPMTVEHMNHERAKSAIPPLEKSRAEQMLLEKQQREKKRLMELEHQSNLKTIKNMEKNKIALSKFMYLENSISTL
jgi:hypothetical protein